MLKVRVGLPCRTVLSVESKEQIINGLVRLANQVLKEKSNLPKEKNKPSCCELRCDNGLRLSCTTFHDENPFLLMNWRAMNREMWNAEHD